MRPTHWILGALLALAAAGLTVTVVQPCALAAYGCTSTTVTLPGGSTIYCTTCCDPYGNNCQTTCGH